VETFLGDVRYAVRQLWASRGLTALAVLTLALGIGSNAALYAVLESVLLRPLPYAHADRLVYIGPREDVPSFSSTSWLNYRDIRDQTQTLQSVAGYVGDLSVLQNGRDAKSIIAMRITPNLLPALGVRPLLARVFTEAEGVSNGPQVAILSEGLWRSEFKADPGIVGRAIKVGEVPKTVVGIMPKSFRFPDANATGIEQNGLWLPLQPTSLYLTTRSLNGISIVAKLRPGVTPRQAQAELDAITERIRRTDPKELANLKLGLTPYQQLLISDVRPALYALLGAVGLVLLIACANVANLLIARCLGRRQEFAVRVALGAGRPRLIRQVLTEGALLSVAGCLCGLMLAMLSLVLVRKLPEGAIPHPDTIGIDWTILLVLAGFATLATLLSSLLPALIASRTDPQEVLQSGSRGLGLRSGSNGLTRWLVIGEVALATLLLVGTGLLFHTLWNLQHVPLGFDTARITNFSVMPGDTAGFSAMSVSAETDHPSASVADTAYAPALARIRTEPGIESAALMTEIPFSGTHVTTSFKIVHEADDPAGRGAQITAASGGYAETMGIRLLRGRMVSDGDTAASPYVAVVNEALAKQYFRGTNPLGRQLDLGKESGMPRPYTIVGIVADTAEGQVGGIIDPQILLPYQQVPTTSVFYAALLDTLMTVVVKSHGEVPVAAEMRSAFKETAPGFALTDFSTMQQVVDKNLFSQRLSLWLTACFAGLAILMVVVGLYGVLAQLVSYRRHEIGIRMALGATREGMARMILRQGGILIGTGLAVGLVLSALLGQLVRSFLYQVPPLDPWTYAGVVLVSVPVGLLASLVPALRAASIEPMQALRDN